ncbi:FAD-binding oxidoreductase [Caulobacter sp. CCG-8]|uniref:FAD-binding oxidoreductase n=1 Tax=Caulobacter sp. CCG-8 TaxID=3127958 RepID=UPI00307DD775
MLDKAHQEALTALVGPDAVIVEAADRAAYETPARYAGGTAAAVVRPATTAQVSAVVGYCVRHALPFLPQGANTGLAGGSTPDAGGAQVVLSLDRLTGPLEIDADDRTATVGAGVRLSALNAALEPHGLFLPIDLGADPSLGGMAATNTGGARFLRYGDMRRHVLGLEVVLADAAGTVLTLSHGLRKDNAAVALRQLFVGGCGAFGVITKVTVEVHHRPRQSATALLVPRDADAVLPLLLAFEAQAGSSLTAFEGMSKAAMTRAIDHVPSLSNPFAGGVPDYAVLVELTRTWTPREGEASLDEVLQQIAGDLLERDDTPLADALFGPAEKMWALRHGLSEGLRASGPVVGFDLSFRRRDLARFRREAVLMLEADFPDFALCDFGHVADGGVHFNLVGSTDAERRAALREAVLGLAVDGFGASFSGEHGLGRAFQDAYDRFTPRLVQDYSAAVAAVFGTGSASVRLGPVNGAN